MIAFAQYRSAFNGRAQFALAVMFAAMMPAGSGRAEPSSSQLSCDAAKKRTCDELVQDNILWKIDEPDNAASKHWLQSNIDALCACTPDPYATVNCFQVQVNNKRKTWQEAIAECRANP